MVIANDLVARTAAAWARNLTCCTLSGRLGRVEQASSFLPARDTSVFVNRMGSRWVVGRYDAESRRNRVAIRDREDHYTRT